MSLLRIVGRCLLWYCAVAPIGLFTAEGLLVLFSPDAFIPGGYAVMQHSILGCTSVSAVAVLLCRRPQGKFPTWLEFSILVYESIVNGRRPSEIAGAHTAE
jgi:hypothetical protein